MGDRLATAYYNALLGGAGASSGPTLAGCTLQGGPGSAAEHSGSAGSAAGAASPSAGPAAATLHIAFDAAMLKGDTLRVNPWGQPYTPPVRHAAPEGGSYLYVQTNASQFCMEKTGVRNETTGGDVPGLEQCPRWAGGDGKAVTSGSGLDGGWTLLNFTADGAGTGIVVDLAPLNGAAPTAVRYAWGIVQCADHADPTLYVTHGAVASCPIYSAAAKLPATPFKARIVGGKCECVAPQVCS